MSPKLSIITINLNNALGLKKTIESVFSQTNQDFEHIIIDGGSNDSSVEVIKSFTSIPPGEYTPENINQLTNKVREKIEKEFNNESHNDSPLVLQRITFWVSELDQGIYHAMNKGIFVARGEYCQFLNSGDWLAAPNVVEEMLNNLSNCSIHYGNMIKHMPNGTVYRDTGPTGEISMMTFYLGTLNHSPALIKRNLFNKYGLYDETLKIVSDWKWYMIAIGLNDELIKYVNVDVSCVDMTGISNTNHTLEKEERRKVLQEQLPSKLLADYDAHWRKIDQVNRINRYKITRFLLWLVDRFLFKIEKIEFKTLKKKVVRQKGHNS